MDDVGSAHVEHKLANSSFSSTAEIAASQNSPVSMEYLSSAPVKTHQPTPCRRGPLTPRLKFLGNYFPVAWRWYQWDQVLLRLLRL